MTVETHSRNYSIMNTMGEPSSLCSPPDGEVTVHSVALGAQTVKAVAEAASERTRRRAAQPQGRCDLHLCHAPLRLDHQLWH